MDEVERIVSIEQQIAKQDEIKNKNRTSPMERRLARRARESIVSNVSDYESDDEALSNDEEYTINENVNNGNNKSDGNKTKITPDKIIRQQTAMRRVSEREQRRSILGDEDVMERQENRENRASILGISKIEEKVGINGPSDLTKTKIKRRDSMLQKAGKRANKHWGKMKAAIKIRQAMKQVHQESKKKLKEDRDAIHNDIVKFFKTRLQKGDKLLAKTVTMGYDFGDLKSHVSEMYRPSGKVRFFFDVLVFFTMILSFYTSTYLFAFVPETLNVSESFILYWAEVIYILDAIHLSIVIYHSRHQPASNYTVEDLDLLENMKRYLIIHFLAAIPFNIVLSTSGTCGAAGRYWCSIPQAFKVLFFLDNVFKCKEHFEKMDGNGRYHIPIQRVFKLFQIVLILFYCGHFIVNSWFYLNSLEDDVDNWFMVHHQENENLSKMSFHQIPLGYFYAQSLYTTLLMLIGDGINPVTSTQYYFCSLIMLLGIVFMAYIIGEISTQIAKVNHAKTLYELKLEDVAECMTNLDMPNELKNRVLDYYRFMWTTHRTTDGEPIPFMKELSPSLSDEVDLFLKRSLIIKSELFKDAPPDYLRALVPRLKHMICLRGDYIAREGEFGDTMYFISSGSCLVSLRNKRIAVLNKGSNFGEIAMVVSKERTASVLALTNVTLYVLHKDDVMDLERHFPNVLQEKIAEYLSKHNLVFSQSPNAGGKGLVANLDVKEKKGNNMFNNTIQSMNQSRPVISPAHSDTTFNSNFSPDNYTRGGGSFLVGKPNLQFINKMASENIVYSDDNQAGDNIEQNHNNRYNMVHNDNLRRSTTPSFNTNITSANFKEMIASVVSDELRNAMGTWMSEQQQNNQKQQNAGVNFRRMSVEMTEQQQNNMTNEPATNVMNSTLEGIEEKNNSFNADAWRRQKILSKRQELKARLSLSPSPSNDSDLKKKIKGKYIATVNQGKIIGSENLNNNNTKN